MKSFFVGLLELQVMMITDRTHGGKENPASRVIRQLV